jgi:hypothetical protein
VHNGPPFFAQSAQIQDCALLNKNVSRRICVEKRQNLDFSVLVHRSVHWFKQYFCVIYYGTMSDNLAP